MLKRWRYVGVYGPELMLCAGSARIGPTRQAWWAVWDRGERRLHERTRFAAGLNRVQLPPDAVRVRDGDVVIELELREERPGVEVITPDSGGYAWTRKQGAASVRGTVTIEGREHAFESAAIVDDSAGYHPRHTAWLWSAGVGSAADGRPVAWNLVDGVHDSPVCSERTAWVDGVASELGPVDFAGDLSRAGFAEGGALSFTAEATRARTDNLLVMRSRYEQPFGTFSGSLPGAGPLAEGFGVMERHDVHW